MKSASICAGFRTCGVYPFDRNAMQCADGVIADSSPHSSSIPTGGE